jgi:3-oxoacyl-[acyl-carrier protein] reductase
VARRLALITGGTSGIGFGVARALAPDHDLALAYRADREKADNARAELARDFPETTVRIFARPLAGAEDARALVEAVIAEHGSAPAVLVHAAGRIADRLFLDGPFEPHAELVQEHLLSAMALCHRLAGGMVRERFGRIVLVSSVGARFHKRGQAGYAAAKAGLEGFTRALALEVAHRGVTVNAVAPGVIDTPMTGPLLAAWEAWENEGGKMRHRIPAGHAGRPEDVAALVRFLCSAEAGYVTGAVIPVDGGRSLGDASS